MKEAQRPPLNGLKFTGLSAKWQEIEVNNLKFSRNDNISFIFPSLLAYFFTLIILGYVDDANGLLKDINTEDLMRVCE